MTLSTQSLDNLLAGSAATEAFKTAVRQLEAGQVDGKISFNAGAPAVKVLRTICKLLEKHPALAIDTVAVKARSGCSDFTGQAVVNADNGAATTFSFVWDCKWRAEQLGWVDPLGMPDQIRAAREYGYQCFEKFEEVQ